jgi:hypothetical protein
MAESITNFDRAQELAMAWPEDKTIPERLAQLLTETDGDPSVAMFFEALYAAAEGADDLELIAGAIDEQ